MNAVRASLQCHVCMKTFKSPITLPCGRTICKYHVPRAGYYECIGCQENHIVPPDGFPESDIGSSLLKRGAAQAYSDPHYRRALLAVDSVGAHLGTLRKQRADKTNESLSMLADLKRKVKKHYNEQAAKILAAYRDASEAVEAAENTSRAELDRSENDRAKEMDEFNERFEKWQKELQRFDVNSDRIYQIALEAEGELIQLRSRMDDLEYEINNIQTQVSPSNVKLKRFFDTKVVRTCSHLSNVCHFCAHNDVKPDVGVGRNIYLTQYINKEDAAKYNRAKKSSTDGVRNDLRHNNYADLAIDGIGHKQRAFSLGKTKGGLFDF